MENNQKIIQEDEIDLRELFLTIWRKKVFIVLLTFIVTVSSILYINFKPYEPLYQGKLLVEIGEVFNKNNDSQLIDYPGNLVKIIEENLSGLISSIPRNTNNLIELSVSSKNKSDIKDTLTSAYDFIVNRHNEKTKLYEKFTHTKKVGDINIGNEPVNKPKKKLIVAVSFVTGFILSIFLVFFMEFIRSFKDKND
uniref:Wzz/FepE/Etk N-terminal domain-containing protein n=1 Tax=Aliarcobacter sp. TaxID=2321116 RepID=UPI004047AC8C